MRGRLRPSCRSRGQRVDQRRLDLHFDAQRSMVQSCRDHGRSAEFVARQDHDRVGAPGGELPAGFTR
jgi:hypothetical protein